VPVHLLLGNHDQLLDQSLRLMPQPEVMALWCENGGLTTLAECGIGLHELDGADPAGIAARLRARLGPRLIRTLRDLAPLWRSGSYLFVHGGIDPTRPPEAHSVADLVWMREPFLAGAGWRHPFAVVHGHTPCGPQLLSHRVAIDSGCFFSGVLTAVELADDRARFHGVTGTPDLSAFLDGIDPGRTLGFTTPERLGP